MKAREWSAIHRIIDAVFEWRGERLSTGRYCVTAYGATAGFGSTQRDAREKAIAATAFDLCGRLPFEQAKLAVMRAVWEHGRRLELL